MKDKNVKAIAISLFAIVAILGLGYYIIRHVFKSMENKAIIETVHDIIRID